MEVKVTYFDPKTFVRDWEWIELEYFASEVMGLMLLGYRVRVNDVYPRELIRNASS